MKGLIAFGVMSGLAGTLLVSMLAVSHGVVSEKDAALQAQRAEVQAAREEEQRLSGIPAEGHSAFGLDEGPLSGIQDYLTTPLFLRK